MVDGDLQHGYSRENLPQGDRELFRRKYYIVDVEEYQNVLVALGDVALNWVVKAAGNFARCQHTDFRCIFHIP